MSFSVHFVLYAWSAGGAIFYRLCQLFSLQITKFCVIEALSSKSKKPFVLKVYYTFRMLGSFSLVFVFLSIFFQVFSQPLIWDVLPTFWYIPAFFAGFVFNNQLVTAQVWFDGVDHLLLYCWGLIETYSAYLDTTSLLKGYQLLAILFFI